VFKICPKTLRIFNFFFGFLNHYFINFLNNR